MGFTSRHIAREANAKKMLERAAVQRVRERLDCDQWRAKMGWAPVTVLYDPYDPAFFFEIDDPSTVR